MKTPSWPARRQSGWGHPTQVICRTYDLSWRSIRIALECQEHCEAAILLLEEVADLVDEHNQPCRTFFRRGLRAQLHPAFSIFPHLFGSAPSDPLTRRVELSVSLMERKSSMFAHEARIGEACRLAHIGATRVRRALW